MQSDTVDVRGLVERSLQLMASGDRDGLDQVYAPDAVNHEAPGEPPPARGVGPEAFLASATWLREAFDGLRFELEQLAVDGDIAAARITMRGRHTGDFPTWEPDGSISAFPPTGREFAQSQIHWFTVRDGLITEHRAQRDDLGMAKQLRWVPPTPLYLLRMGAARRRATKRWSTATVGTSGQAS